MSDTAISRPRKPTQLILLINYYFTSISFLFFFCYLCISYHDFWHMFFFHIVSMYEILMWWYFLLDDESDMLYNWRRSFFKIYHSCISDNIHNICIHYILRLLFPIWHKMKQFTQIKMTSICLRKVSTFWWVIREILSDASFFFFYFYFLWLP